MGTASWTTRRFHVGCTVGSAPCREQERTEVRGEERPQREGDGRSDATAEARGTGAERHEGREPEAVPVGRRSVSREGRPGRSGSRAATSFASETEPELGEVVRVPALRNPGLPRGEESAGKNRSAPAAASARSAPPRGARRPRNAARPPAAGRRTRRQPFVLRQDRRGEEDARRDPLGRARRARRGARRPAPQNAASGTSAKRRAGSAAGSGTEDGREGERENRRARPRRHPRAGARGRRGRGGPREERRVERLERRAGRRRVERLLDDDLASGIRIGYCGEAHERVRVEERAAASSSGPREPSARRRLHGISESQPDSREVTACAKSPSVTAARSRTRRPRHSPPSGRRDRRVGRTRAARRRRAARPAHTRTIAGARTIRAGAGRRRGSPRTRRPPGPSRRRGGTPSRARRERPLPDGREQLDESEARHEEESDAADAATSAAARSTGRPLPARTRVSTSAGPADRGSGSPSTAGATRGGRA